MNSPEYRRSTDLLEADVGDELVALDPGTGTCLGFNEVAAFVWRRLSSPATFEQLTHDLLAEYDVNEQQCVSELRELLNDMTARGLVTIDREQLRQKGL